MRYCVDICAVELSVEELCALAHKSGHLNASHARRPASRRPLPLPKSLHLPKEERSTSVLLRNTVSFEGITFTVEGTADAVVEGKLPIVEEIKTEKGRGDSFSRLRALAYMLCEAREVNSVRLRMRVVDLEKETFEDVERTVTRGELAEFYDSLLARIYPVARELVERFEVRLPTVDSLRFPYPHVREGQSELAELCFSVIRKGERLFAQAPTGIGKTMSTLFPAVKALGKGYCDRIFYLTAKTVTGREAYAAAAKLYEAGSRLRTVMLSAKEQMCLHPCGCQSGGGSNCTAERCSFAAGYYDRVGAALSELLSGHHGFPKGLLREVAMKHRICPHELSLDLSEFCEIIICDYNYALSPDVYLRRFFDSEVGERGRYAFLIDEAHNLPDRARDMYSATLSSACFETLYETASSAEIKELEKPLSDFLLTFERLGELCVENRTKNEDGTENGYYLNRAPLENFTERSAILQKQLDAFLKRNGEHPISEAVHEATSALRRFSMLAEYYDARFLTYVEKRSDKLTAQIICLDPAGVMHTAMGRASAAILFSATLKPVSYFVDILGGGKRAETLELASPYDPERLCVTVATGVDTRMEERHKSYKKVATLIAAAISARAGNYMVYFPSYDYMEKVVEQFEAKYPGVPHTAQKRGMTVAQREEFLAYFKEDEGKMRVGFCVLGGSFSEGVDLPGSRLIGAIIVGVGIPGLSNERNMLRDYYDVKCEEGYHYAYTFPGMNRVLQAAGRVIRREEDRGVVVLIDNRYAEEPYLHLYPAHWTHVVAAGNAASLAERHKRFWAKDF